MRFDKTRLILIAVAAVLVIVLAALVIIALGDLNDRENEIPQPTNAPTVQPQEGQDVPVKTPYGTMVFPGKWSAYLHVDRVEQPELKICFTANLPSGKVQNLFDIRFGEALDPAVGQVVTSEGVAVGVHVTIHPFDPDGSWSVNEIDAVTEMIESLNDVLEGLHMVPLGTPIPEISGDEMVIDTPYCKLYLPKRWVEELRIAVDESDGYEVVFSAVIGQHDPVRIFAVNFGGSESRGHAAHTLKTENDVPFVVRVRIFDLNTQGWSTVDRSTLLAMQEDLNHLLEKLQQE